MRVTVGLSNLPHENKEQLLHYHYSVEPPSSRGGFKQRYHLRSAVSVKYKEALRILCT